MSENLRGIVAMLLSATGFVVNDAFVKLATAELPAGEIIVIRGVLSTIILGVAAHIAGAWRPIRVLAEPAMAVRLITAALSTLCIVIALRAVPLATSTAILQVTPLAVTAGAALIQRTTVGWRRWLASLTGFAGVLLIVRPGSDSFVPEIWITLLSLVFTVTRDLTTRFIRDGLPSLLVAVGSAAVVTLVGFTRLPFETWIVPSPRGMALLSGAAVCIYFAYYFGIVAMRTGEIASVAPFRYTSIPLAVLLGWAGWGHIPDLASLAGISVVALAGLYLLMMERSEKRRVAKLQTDGDKA